MSWVICLGLQTFSLGDLGLVGQDLHIAAPAMTISTTAPAGWSQLMLLEQGCTLQIGDNTLSGRDAVLWIRSHPAADQAGVMAGHSYLVQAYLEGDVSVQKGSKSRTTSIQHMRVQGAEVLLTQFLVTGDIFASADRQGELSADYLEDNELFRKASRAVVGIPSGPAIPDSAAVPNPQSVITRPGAPFSPDAEKVSSEIAKQLKQSQQTGVPVDGVVSGIPVYPVELSAVWEPVPQVEKKLLPDGQEVIVASGRFYLWQKRDDGQNLEFMADRMVLFFEQDEFEIKPSGYTGTQLGSGKIQSAFLSGNIVMTEGSRTIRADELYYDFTNYRALVVNSSLRVFDEQRGIPVYLRAERLGRVSKDIFEARQVQLTSSEFYLPQVSLNASKMVLLTGEALEHYYTLSEQSDPATEYEARLYDVKGRLGDVTFFSWPKIVTNFARPDIPLRRATFGNDSDFGTSIQTRWKLAPLLGVKDPEWIDSQLNLDYFSLRGVGAGIDAEYERDDMMGSLISYIMTDQGEDDLGRTRRNIDPEQDVRGRFSLRHRQYLPNDWQFTLETGYVTDENFIEAMYRHEFYTDKEQETLVYLKQLKDNRAFSILGKIRINDWTTEQEELPSLEYHVKGQSFWDHRLTWYSDSQLARFRDSSATSSSGLYTFAFSRNEVDLPVTIGSFKLVPFAAASYGYEDNTGFAYDLSDMGTGTLSREDQVFLTEVGLRASTMFWKEDPYYRSELWDLRGMRHIITPYAELVMYEASDDSIEMRDVIHLGLSQRWQTHRGGEENPRTLDWMRLDLEGTWLSDDAASPVGSLNASETAAFYGPAAFVYNDPSIPFLLRRDGAFFGMARDTLNAEYAWRVTDTFTLLGDANYDLQSGDLQQLDVGISRYVYPNMSYYMGTRYLRPVVVAVDEDGGGTDFYERGSAAFVAAVTYRFSSRYLATFTQEYNFDYGKPIRSDLAIIRQYHRMFYSMSFSMDESLDRTSILFSVWPQGVDELAIGSRRYTGLTGTRWED